MRLVHRQSQFRLQGDASDDGYIAKEPPAADIVRDTTAGIAHLYVLEGLVQVAYGGTSYGWPRQVRSIRVMIANDLNADQERRVRVERYDGNGDWISLGALRAAASADEYAYVEFVGIVTDEDDVQPDDADRFSAIRLTNLTNIDTRICVIVEGGNTEL